MFGSFFLLVLVAFGSGPLLTSATPDNDRDNMAGQVPVKNTPINILNNITLSPGDFSRNKGCQGENCKSTTNEEYRLNANKYWGDAGSSDELDLCDMPRDYGDCAHRMIRWYFDRRDGFCRRFIYSGCGGNSNNFQGSRRCQEQCTGLYGSGSGRRAQGHKRRSGKHSARGSRGHGRGRGGGWGWGAEEESDEMSEDVDADGEGEEWKVETKSTHANKTSHGKKKGGAGGKKRVVYEETVVEEDVDE